MIYKPLESKNQNFFSHSSLEDHFLEFSRLVYRMEYIMGLKFCNFWESHAF